MRFNRLTKKFIYLPLCLILLAQPGFAGNLFFSDKDIKENDPQEGLILSMIKYANAFVGTPYRYGSTGPYSFDCSGFTGYIFSQFGFKIGRTSREQAKEGDKVELDSVRPGDLIFFNGRRVNGNIGHVGIVTENDSTTGKIRFIHAAVHGGISESDLSEEYFKKRYVSACRILPQDSSILSAEMPDPETTIEDKPDIYRVKQGDNLGKIARQYSCSIQELMKWNSLKSTNLKIGQNLKLFPVKNENSDV